MKYYVYALCEPDSRTIRYIGVSTNPIRRRYQHISVSKKGGSSPLCNWLRSLSKKPNLIILRETSETEWQEDEKLFIRNARMLGMALVNATDGGRNSTPNPETRAKLSAAHKGVRLSPEHCAAAGAAQKGVPKSPRHCAAMKAAYTEERRKADSKAKKVLWTTPEYQAKMKARKKRGKQIDKH